MKENENLASKTFDIINYILLSLLALIFFLPLWFVVMCSFSDGLAVLRNEVFLFPIQFNIDTYAAVFRNDRIIDAYASTIFYAVIGVSINMFLTILCAYPLSRKDFYGRKIFSMFIIFTMFFGGGMIPTYIVVTQTLHLRGNFMAALLVSGINTFNMILMRTFFEGLPESIFESARMDGASDYRILARLILPLSKPILATIFLYYTVDLWNSYFNFALYLSNHIPLQVFIKRFIIDGATGDMAYSFNGHVSDVTVRYAVIAITIAPIICIYPFIQKYLIKGSLMGSIKG